MLYGYLKKCYPLLKTRNWSGFVGLYDVSRTGGHLLLVLKSLPMTVVVFMHFETTMVEKKKKKGGGTEI